MADIESPSSDVLVLHLSPYHSLDIVRVPTSTKYRIVFAERWGVQRRAFVEVSFDEALVIAKFLSNISEDVAAIMDPSPLIAPPPDPLPLPPIPRTRTRSSGPGSSE